MSTDKQHLIDTGNDPSFDGLQTIPIIEQELVVASKNIETGWVLLTFLRI